MTRAERMAEALTAIVESFWGREGETRTEAFDRRAAQFHAETGHYRPGKDVPVAVGARDEEEDRAAWFAWLDKEWFRLRDSARAALALPSAPEATPALCPRCNDGTKLEVYCPDCEWPRPVEMADIAAQTGLGEYGGERREGYEGPEPMPAALASAREDGRRAGIEEAARAITPPVGKNSDRLDPKVDFYPFLGESPFDLLVRARARIRAIGPAAPDASEAGPPTVHSPHCSVFDAVCDYGATPSPAEGRAKEGDET